MFKPTRARSVLTVPLCFAPAARHTHNTNTHRVGTGVVVASLYYQGASKGKDGHGGKAAAKEGGSKGGSGGVAASKSTGGARERISFGGVGQTPTRATGGMHDEEETETAQLLDRKEGG